MESIQIKITGLVQGVFFRVSAQDCANKLGITGWVKNCPDGSVEALIEADDDQISAFLDWCSQGPSGAQVDQVEIIDRKDCTNQQEGFNIIYE